MITISTTGASSTLRVHAWRRLRALGGHYLQQSVCVLPERPSTVRAVTRLLARVQREGSECRLLHVALHDQEEEAELIAAFSRERTDEYGEVVSRTKEFLGEIEMERERGRASYTEVEESDADLQRFQRWLASIKQRDYFDAAGHDEAAHAVAQCEQRLAEFEAEAFASEQHEAQPSQLPQRRLRSVSQDKP